MTIENQNFTMFMGETKKLLVTVTGKNLTGATISWYLSDENDRDRKYITKTTASGISITDAPNGKYTVTIDEADSAGLVDKTPKTFYHCSVVVDSANDTSIVLDGYAVISPSAL